MAGWNCWCSGNPVFSLESVLFQKGLENGNVLSTYVYSTNMTGFLIAYSFCAFPFAGVYPEEQEHKYIRYNVIRGSLKSYVLSKTTVIYISSLSIMILGSVLFLFCVVHMFRGQTGV